MQGSLMRIPLIHVALVLFLSVVEVFFFVGHLLFMLDFFFISLLMLFELSAAHLPSISLTTGHSWPVNDWYRFAVDRFVVNISVVLSLITLVMGNSLKSLIV